jgi:hypothetical protein
LHVLPGLCTPNSGKFCLQIRPFGKLEEPA